MKRGAWIGVTAAGAGLLGFAVGALVAEGRHDGGPGREGGDVSVRRSAKSDRDRGHRVASARSSAEALGEIDDEFVRWLRGASADEIRARILEECNGPFGSMPLRAQIMLRGLLLEDAQRTFDYFSKNAGKLTNFMSTMLHLWANISPHEAAEAIYELSKRSGGPFGMEDRFAGFGLSRLAKEDVQGALALADRYPHGSRFREAAFKSVLIGYASLDPPDLPELLARAGKEGLDTYELQSSLRAWWKVAPERAFAWVRENLKERGEVPVPILSEIADRDPRRALELHHEFNGLEVTSHYSGYVENWAGMLLAQDFDGGLAWIESHMPSERLDRTLRRAVQNLARIDPGLVAERVFASDPTVLAYANINSLADELLEAVGGDAVRLIQDVPEAVRDDLRAGLMRDGYLEPTREYLEARLGSAHGFYNSAMSAMLMRDPDRILEVITELGAEQQTQALQEGAGVIARRVPNRLLEMVGRVEDPVAFASGPAQHAIVTITYEDPARARELAAALPDGDARRIGVKNVTNNLIMDDPQGTLEWLRGQRTAFGEGDTFDNYVQDLRRKYPWEVERIESVLGDAPRSP